jgi:hypothetical protein
MISMRWSPLTLLLLTLALAPRTGAAAPDAGRPAPASDRSPQAILADYAKAVGAGAIAKRKNLRLRRELTLKAMGVNGKEERWAAAGDKMLVVMTINGIGTVKQGSTGTVRWSQDPINGLRVLSGAEGEMARIESAWNADQRLAELFTKLRTVPPPEAAPKGKPLECVELTPREGSPIAMCFDAGTHLRVFQAGKQASPQGEVPYTARQSEWVTIDGVKFPGVEELNAGPASMELRLIDLVFDQKVAPNLFQMPKPGTPAAKAPPASP